MRGQQGLSPTVRTPRAAVEVAWKKRSLRVAEATVSADMSMRTRRKSSSTSYIRGSRGPVARIGPLWSAWSAFVNVVPR